MEKERLPAQIKSVSKHVSIGLIKGALNSIPVIGAYLDEGIFEVRSRIKQERFEKLVNYLQDQVKMLGDNAINKAFLESEEFIDLFDNVVEKSLKTRHEEKIELYAKILSSSIKNGELTDYDSELSFINIIDNLTVNELIVIKNLSLKKYANVGIDFGIKESEEEIEARERYYRNHKFDFEAVRLDYNQELLFGLIPVKTRIAIEGLIAKSLALDESFSRIETDPRTYIALTPLGKQLIEFLIAKVQDVKIIENWDIEANADLT